MGQVMHGKADSDRAKPSEPPFGLVMGMMAVGMIVGALAAPADVDTADTTASSVEPWVETVAEVVKR